MTAELQSSDGCVSAPRIALIYNPTAGRRRAPYFAAVQEALRARGAALSVQATEKPGDAARLAQAAGQSEFDTVAVAGGDGTINEAINGLAGSPLPLGIVPLGTANVLAHELRLDFAARAVAATLATGAIRTIRLGQVENGSGRRRFAMMAGIGFDAAVVAGLDLDLKRRFGKLAYVKQTLVQWRRNERFAYRLIVDGMATQGASAILANGRFYGGRFVAAPLADLAAASLEVVLFRRGGRWAALRYAMALAAGRLHRLPDVEVIRAHRVDVHGPTGEPIQADGDIVAQLPARITTASESLRVRVPRM